MKLLEGMGASRACHFDWILETRIYESHLSYPTPNFIDWMDEFLARSGCNGSTSWLIFFFPACPRLWFLSAAGGKIDIGLGLLSRIRARGFPGRPLTSAARRTEKAGLYFEFKGYSAPRILLRTPHSDFYSLGRPAYLSGSQVLHSASALAIQMYDISFYTLNILCKFHRAFMG